MSENRGGATASLGDVEPARSRHLGRRSAVALHGDCAVVGTAGGAVRAVDRRTGRERWRDEPDVEASVVAAEPFDGGVAVGERGPRGGVRVYDGSGDRRWRYETARDVGDPAREGRFFRPFVADLTAAGDRLVAAARRYEREADRRHFESVVYAFEPEGGVAWRYATDASPIAVDAADGRVAVAYNRCSGDHQHGLVVLDASTGEPRWNWDPGTEGQRRVGDASLLPDGVAVASHGDYRGYRLGAGGAERWRVDLATPVDRAGETVYAYPNHVHATDAGAVFVTGNTYPEDGRETAARHPREHAAVGVAPDGTVRWEADVGGFATGIDHDGETVAVPAAQNFRERTPDAHGWHVLDVAAGHAESVGTPGIVTAVGTDGSGVAAVEEPVVYHDDGERRGSYRLVVRPRR